MRFLLDACAAYRSLRALLDDLGHDVVSALNVDPHAADEALLARAREEQRILVTGDKDFGELVFVRRLPHPCIIRFVDLRVTDQVTAMRELLGRHERHLRDGVLLVVSRQAACPPIGPSGRDVTQTGLESPPVVIAGQTWTGPVCL